MPCNEDDWELPARCDKLALKIKATLTWQSHVEHQTGGAIWQFGGKKFFVAYCAGAVKAGYTLYSGEES